MKRSHVVHWREWLSVSLCLRAQYITWRTVKALGVFKHCAQGSFFWRDSGWMCSECSGGAARCHRLNVKSIVWLESRWQPNGAVHQGQKSHLTERSGQGHPRTSSVRDKRGFTLSVCVVWAWFVHLTPVWGVKDRKKGVWKIGMCATTTNRSFYSSCVRIWLKLCENFSCLNIVQCCYR